MTLVDRVRERFLQSPGEWIDGREFVKLAGFGGWSSRIRDLRKPKYGGMTIENKLGHRKMPDGTVITDSFYRWVPDRQWPNIRC